MPRDIIKTSLLGNEVPRPNLSTNTTQGDATINVLRKMPTPRRSARISASKTSLRSQESSHQSTLPPVFEAASATGDALRSPMFDFGSDETLSEEAQRIMNSVREEAARIKFQMVEDKARDEPIARGGPSARRFSDMHRKQFSKMPSIGALPRTAAATYGQHHAHGAHNDGRSAAISPRKPLVMTHGNQAQVTSTKSTSRKEDKGAWSATTSDDGSVRTALKRKLPAALDDGDVSKRRRQDADTPQMPMSAPPKSRYLPSVISTPTQASLARSKFPMKKMGSPDRAISRARVGSAMKSILHRPLFKFSDDPHKLAAGTHLPLENQPLPPVPHTPVLKRVEFKAGTKIGDEAGTFLSSPSPSRLPTPMSKIVYPSLGTALETGDFTFRANQAIQFRATPCAFGEHEHKRKHAEDAENQPVTLEPSAKRSKTAESPTRPHVQRSTGLSPRAPSPKKTGISMSRLNMLARPKVRT